MPSSRPLYSLVVHRFRKPVTGLMSFFILDLLFLVIRPHNRYRLSSFSHNFFPHSFHFMSACVSYCTSFSTEYSLTGVLSLPLESFFPSLLSNTRHTLSVSTFYFSILLSLVFLLVSELSLLVKVINNLRFMSFQSNATASILILPTRERS
jgi:hypothetical protein